MATGVKPRDEDTQFTRSDLEAIQDAMKDKKFRDLLSEYCEEVRDPANQALYQKEMVQLEKERGYDVTFINPKGGYVIKTSVAGDRKAFINVCSNDNVGKPSYSVQEVQGKRGMNWQIPYSIIPPREDFDHSKKRCVIYDVVFHPDTLRMAEVNKQFRELVNKTAFDGLQKTYNIHLDSNNVRFPKSNYKGMTVPAVIRKEDPNFKPPKEEEIDALSPEIIDKLYPQKIHPSRTEITPNVDKQSKKGKQTSANITRNGYTVPKYVIKQQKNVDLQDYTFHRDSKQYTAIPSQIVVEINLPLLSSTKDCILDVHEKTLSLKSETPAKYKLDINLPYSVNDECGNAKFDKTKRMLIVTLPVIRKVNEPNDLNSLRVDSGVESEEHSPSQSDEENSSNMIVELSSLPNESCCILEQRQAKTEAETFLDPSLGYILPPYTHNALDDIVAFTFHVKNTEPNSVKVKSDANKVYIKFTSIGSGFVPVHYAAIIVFKDNVNFENVSGEAWDNNVILQLEIPGEITEKFEIGLSSESMTCGYLDMSHVKKTSNVDNKVKAIEEPSPNIEVTNLGSETNIIVSSKPMDEDELEDDIDSPTFNDREIVWTESNSVSGAKSILRKPMSRSYSESSYGDIASSMDYISSDCIPEESSFKKTVRFNDVIARQFYRYNSSIEAQKKKNQKKKSKKRSQERRKSESEAEEDSMNTSLMPKSRLKSALKLRRDSGLADTSDAEAEGKTPNGSYTANGHEHSQTFTNRSSKSILNIVDNKENVSDEADIWEKETEKVNKEVKTEPLTCENISHKTDFYDPDRLNKGQYLEVKFKNELIFDLDM